MTIYKADRLIHMQILVFEPMADSPGPFATITLNAVERMQFDSEYFNTPKAMFASTEHSSLGA